MRAVLIDDGFWYAVVAGVVGAALVALVGRRFRVPFGYAAVAVVATLIGFRGGHRLGDQLVVALALLALGEWVAAVWRSPVAGFVCALPGAVMLAVSLPDGFPQDLRVVVAVTTVLAAPIVVVTARREPRLVAVMFAVTAVGVYACVPDTEHAKALLGALLAAGLLTFDRRLVAVSGVGAVTGLVVWTVALGGIGRAGSVVGGIACLGVLVLLPLTGWGRVGRGHPLVALVVHVLLAAFAARVAGFEDDAVPALVLAVPAIALAWGVLALVVRQWPERSPAERSGPQRTR